MALIENFQKILETNLEEPSPFYNIAPLENDKVKIKISVNIGAFNKINYKRKSKKVAKKTCKISSEISVFEISKKDFNMKKIQSDRKFLM